MPILNPLFGRAVDENETDRKTERQKEKWHVEIVEKRYRQEEKRKLLPLNWN